MTTSSTPHHLALTIGDPTGIGPEITAKALARLVEFPNTSFTVIGDIAGLEKTAAELGIALPQHSVTYINISADKPGAVAYQAIEEAVRLTNLTVADAIVTGPISKKNLIDAGYNAEGHTEILQTLAQKYYDVPDARPEMLFVHNNLRLLLLTRHIPLSAVPEALSKPGAVAKPIKTLLHFLRTRARIDEVRIAMLALNPHAGEVGGEEEQKYLAPIIHAVNGIGNSRIDGPFPADGFFRGFDAASTPYHAIIACYHDQGLIPFKLLAGYHAVNVTIGLPFIRTSVSHGTAQDIVGQGIADEASLVAAIHKAIKLSTPA